MGLVSANEFALRMGVAKRTIEKAMKDGKLKTHLNDSGRHRLDLDEAKKDFEHFFGHLLERNKRKIFDPEAQPIPKKFRSQYFGNQTKKENKDESNPEQPNENQNDEPQNDEPQPEHNLSRYQKAKEDNEFFKAKLAQMEFDKESGKLVDAQELETKMFDVARKTRDALLNIPNRFGSEVASETNPVKVHAILTKAINQALDELVKLEGTEIGNG